MGKLQRFSLLALSAFMLLAGINHFVNPGFYLDIMPSWLPAKDALNTISGAAEILLAIGLIPEATRRLSSKLIVVMLFLFLAVHIDHIIHPPEFVGDYPAAVTWMRLLIQFILMHWAWRVGSYR